MNCNKCKKKTKCLTWRYEDVEMCKHFKPKTQFDRIKAMSVEDFVNWVLVDSDVIARRYIDSFIGLREYLESEVQEDEM